MRLIQPKLKKFWSPAIITNVVGGVAGLPVLSFVSSPILSNSGTTCTVATANIGNPGYIATRRVFVCAGRGQNANGPVTSATINGVTATIHLDAELTTALATIVIFSALVTSGTTNVTITVNFTGSQFAAFGAAVYNVDNSLLNSTTATGTGSAQANAVTSLACSSVTTSAGGFILAACGVSSGSTGLAFTGMTTDAFGGTNTSVESSQTGLAGGTLTPTATWGTSKNAGVGAAAFR